MADGPPHVVFGVDRSNILDPLIDLTGLAFWLLRGLALLFW